MVLIDAETGNEAEPVVVDRDTGRRVDGPDFVFTAGPAASKPFRDRYQGRPNALNRELVDGAPHDDDHHRPRRLQGAGPVLCIIEKGPDGIADGGHFDLLAENVTSTT